MGVARRECLAERGRALRVLRCLRSVGRESLKPRLCDERIKSPILVSLIGRGSVPLRSGNVPRTRVSPNCVSAGLGIHPILFPLWEEFSWLVPALLGNFPGFFPLCFLFLGEFSPFLPFFPGVIPRAKGYLGSVSSFISVEGLGFRPSNPFPRSRYPFLDNYFWADPQPATKERRKVSSAARRLASQPVATTKLSSRYSHNFYCLRQGVLLRDGDFPTQGHPLPVIG